MPSDPQVRLPASAPPPNLPPPFCNIASIPNLRDAGNDYAVASRPDSRVLPRRIYRSAEPTRAPLDDIRTLHAQLGIRVIFDLRSAPEIERSGTLPAFEARLAEYNASLTGAERETKGTIERRWTPVFPAADYSPDALARRFADYGADEGVAGFVRAYGQILGAAGPAVKSVLEYLGEATTDGGGAAAAAIAARAGAVGAASAGAQVTAARSGGSPGAILLHCTAGKDRAGTLVALLLSLLGVPPATVARDYGLTELGLANQREAFVQRLVALPGGPFADTAEGRASAARMFGAREEAMLATLDMVGEKYGGVEGYVRDVAGVDDEVVRRLREGLIGTGGSDCREGAAAVDSGRGKEDGSVL